ITSKYRQNDYNNDLDLSRLKKLRLLSVEDLIVRYFIKETGHNSPDVSAQSARDIETNTVFFKKENGLSYLASEIARLILSRTEEGLPSNILHILNAETESAAHGQMDGLGIPRVDTSELVSPAPQELSEFSNIAEKDSDLTETSLIKNE